MKIFERERLTKLRGLLATGQPEPRQQAERIVRVQRDVVLPSKAGLSLVVIYYLFYSGWNEEQTALLALDTLKKFFLIYLMCNFVGAILLGSWRRLPTGLVQWVAFTLGLLDGLFMAGITSATGGFASIAFLVFPGLIVLNALSIPLATPQIVLNLLLSAFYLSAVLVTPYIGWDQPLSDPQILANVYSTYAIRPGPTNGVPGSGSAALHSPAGNTQAMNLSVPPGSNGVSRHGTNTLAKLNKFAWASHAREENPTDDIAPQEMILRVAVLWLLTLCCYGAQLLLERQRLAVQEAAEFAAREGQLHSAGRLAAEFAHQIKNPLAIINNAAYSLQRSLRDHKNSTSLQIEIIQEEVARADKVITQIMGYAQLSEGRVERLSVVEEIKRACDQVFPEAVSSGIKLKKRFSGPFPSLLMQRIHLSEALVNLMQNARDALNGKGTVTVSANCSEDQVVQITVADDGPGIAPDKLGRVFEAYFTTKEKGTGLGLAIVKHNAELYGGGVRVESVLGKGATFTIILPSKSQTKPFAK
jgi:signal transduction histidine kinase